jgi:hypothetical protein
MMATIFMSAIRTKSLCDAHDNHVRRVLVFRFVDGDRGEPEFGFERFENSSLLE